MWRFRIRVPSYINSKSFIHPPDKQIGDLTEVLDKSGIFDLEVDLSVSYLNPKPGTAASPLWILYYSSIKIENNVLKKLIISKDKR
jgi:hypothetical protein